MWIMYRIAGGCCRQCIRKCETKVIWCDRLRLPAKPVTLSMLNKAITIATSSKQRFQHLAPSFVDKFSPSRPMDPRSLSTVATISY